MCVYAGVGLICCRDADAQFALDDPEPSRCAAGRLREGRVNVKRLISPTLIAVAWLVLATGSAHAASDRGVITYDTSRGIFAVNPDGSGSRMLISTRGARGARWSPDGRRFAYTQYREVNAYKRGWTYRKPVIVIASPDGRHRRVIARGTAPRWSADGRALLFAGPIRGADLANNDEMKQPVKRFDVKTGEISNLGIVGSPYALSPDLTQIAGDDGITTIATGERAEFSLPSPRFWTGPMYWLVNGLLAWNCYTKKRADADVCLGEVSGSRLRLVRRYDTLTTGRFPSGRRARIFEQQIAFSPTGRFVVLAGPGGIYTATKYGRRMHWLARNPAMNGSDNPFSPDWRPR
jgi:hypothetical protein